MSAARAFTIPAEKVFNVHLHLTRTPASYINQRLRGEPCDTQLTLTMISLRGQRKKKEGARSRQAPRWTIAGEQKPPNPTNNHAVWPCQRFPSLSQCASVLSHEPVIWLLHLSLSLAHSHTYTHARSLSNLPLSLSPFLPLEKGVSHFPYSQ